MTFKDIDRLGDQFAQLDRLCPRLGPPIKSPSEGRYIMQVDYDDSPEVLIVDVFGDPGALQIVGSPESRWDGDLSGIPSDAVFRLLPEIS